MRVLHLRHLRRLDKRNLLALYLSTKFLISDEFYDILRDQSSDPPSHQSMSAISDFTPSEEWIIQTTLTERYGAAPELQLADAEIRLSASDRELTLCPVIIWQENGCSFVIFKTGDRRYRSQFFYQSYKQYGTGIREYEDLTECTVALLQAQADQLAEERGDLIKKRR